MGNRGWREFKIQGVTGPDFPGIGGGVSTLVVQRKPFHPADSGQEWVTIRNGRRTIGMKIPYFDLAILFLLVFLNGSLFAATDDKQEWLASQLYGSDNEAASLRPVTIKPQGDKYLIHIANQFSFQCELTFDAHGNPEKLLNCRSLLEEGGQPIGSWQVRENEIPLSCSRSAGEVVCKGAYTLVGRSYTSKASMTIARSLGASFDCSKARAGVEQIICKDSRLRSLDRDLFDTYQENLRNSHDQALLRSEQLAWLRNVRDKCTTAGCVENAYAQRISELHDSLVDGRKESSGLRGATAAEVSGRYVRKGKNEEAELSVTALADNKVRIKGLALWDTGSEGGPHTGDLDFEAPLTDGRVYFTDRYDPAHPYRLRIDFQKDRLKVTETNSAGYFGLNVSFEGEYRRVAPKGDPSATTGKQ